MKKSELLIRTLLLLGIISSINADNKPVGETPDETPKDNPNVTENTLGFRTMTDTAKPVSVTGDDGPGYHDGDSASVDFLTETFTIPTPEPTNGPTNDLNLLTAKPNGAFAREDYNAKQLLLITTLGAVATYILKFI